MGNPTLFDEPARQSSARRTDPPGAHAAAALVKPGNDDQVRAIRKHVFEHGPLTAWEIADGVIAKHGDRWQYDSLRSACSRAKLEEHHGGGKSPGGRSCILYSLYSYVVPVGDVL